MYIVFVLLPILKRIENRLRFEGPPPQRPHRLRLPARDHLKVGSLFTRSAEWISLRSAARALSASGVPMDVRDGVEETLPFEQPAFTGLFLYPRFSTAPDMRTLEAESALASELK